MILKVSVVVVVFAVLIRGQIAPTETYTHSATLKSGTIKLYWRFNDTHITFEVHGQTTGWVGIGFSPNGAMTGADIFVGWVKDGQTKVTDRHGVGNTFPPLDPQQDIDVLGGNESDGWTMFKLSRQLAACEPEYDREITQDTQRLIYAWGTEDPTGDDIAQANYHQTNRGVESMYFLQSADTPSGLPVGPTYQSFEILMDKFEVPAEDTYYNCKLFKIPDFTKKHHVVEIEPIIQKGNELIVHHILVHRCGDVLQNSSELEQDSRCYTPNMEHFATCSTVLSGWAIGGTALIFPDEAGLSVGAEGDPVYIQLEIHYDNPTEKSGIVDSSGIRMTYTETIREYDIGIWQLGVTTSGLEHLIPPGAESFLTAGYCTPFCLEYRMSEAGVDNVTVFSVLLHSHLAGRSLRLRHIRDGVELPYLASDQYYDFNYQETRFLNPAITVKSTDTLITECIYNTQDRQNMTEGGLGTPQEMCLTYVAYYPKIDLSYCMSSVSAYLTWPYLGIVESVDRIDGTDGTSLDHYSLNGVGKTVYEYMNEYNWTAEAIKNFESYYNSREHYEICLPANRSNAIFQTFKVTVVDFPYVTPEKTCQIPATSKPTSQIPATSKPTSEIPATSIPTSQIPATSKPTSEIPATSKPTSSSAFTVTTTSGAATTPASSRAYFALILLTSVVAFFLDA